MRRAAASAPGKALLCGEYAVLEGAPAVVAAVDRRVIVRWTDDEVTMPPEARATLERAQRATRPVDGALDVDATALRRGDVKLGVGSSAAAAAASAAAVFASHDYDVEDVEVRRRIFACALEGHATVAPQGSGVDVAASTFGGFLRYRKGVASPPSLRIPRDLRISLVWTGHAARTSDLVARVGAFGRAQPTQYRALLEALAGLAEAFAEAFERGTAEDVVRAAGRYGAAMGALGDAAQAPIVESRLSTASDLAGSFSGAAKPCGAGGGDVAIAFFTDPERARAFELACEDKGLHPIDVSFGAEGVRSE